MTLVELAQRQVDRAGKVRRGIVVLRQYLYHLRSAVDQLLQLFQPDPRGHDGVTVAQAEAVAPNVDVHARRSEGVAERARDDWPGHQPGSIRVLFLGGGLAA